MHPVLPPSTGTSQTENAFLASRAFVFANGGDRLLFPARMACTLFSLVTALLVYAAGRRCFGTLAGVCSLFLFAFDANLLVHGTLISTDVGSACSLLGTVYAFYRYSIQPSWKLLLVAGLLAGLALVTKSTGILIAPMLLLFAAIEGVRERRVLRSGGIVFASFKDYDELVKTRPTFQGAIVLRFSRRAEDCSSGMGLDQC